MLSCVDLCVCRVNFNANFFWFSLSGFVYFFESQKLIKMQKLFVRNLLRGKRLLDQRSRKKSFIRFFVVQWIALPDCLLCLIEWASTKAFVRLYELEFVLCLALFGFCWVYSFEIPISFFVIFVRSIFSTVFVDNKFRLTKLWRLSLSIDWIEFQFNNRILVAWYNLYPTQRIQCRIPRRTSLVL